MVRTACKLRRNRKKKLFIVSLLIHALVSQNTNTRAKGGNRHLLVDYGKATHLDCPNNSNITWFEEKARIVRRCGPGSKPQYVSPGRNKHTLSPNGTLIVWVKDDNDDALTYCCQAGATNPKCYTVSIRVRPDVHLECDVTKNTSKKQLECKGKCEVQPHHLAYRVTLLVCSRQLKEDMCDPERDMCDPERDMCDPESNYTLQSNNSTDSIHLIIPNPSSEKQYYLELAFSSSHQEYEEIKLVITGKEVAKETTTAPKVGGFVTSREMTIGSSNSHHATVTPHNATDLSTVRTAETIPSSTGGIPTFQFLVVWFGMLFKLIICL